MAVCTSYKPPFAFICLKLIIDGIVYNDDEQELHWKANNGTCGWAWKKNKISFYDSKNKDLKAPNDRLSEKQKEITKDIKSILSVPIWSNEDIMGVLNVDSKHNVDDTLFTQPDVFLTVTSYARAISGIFFVDGVEG